MPFIDSVEASIAIARLYGARFSIVTTVETMAPGIKTLVENLGATYQCTVRAVAIERLDETIISAQNVDGAKVIILGSGGLMVQAQALTKKHGIPVIDCIEAAIKFAEMAAK